MGDKITTSEKEKKRSEERITEMKIGDGEWNKVFNK